VDDAARAELDDEEREQRAEQQVGDRQEVASPDVLRVVAQEGGPGLAGVMWRPRSSQILLDGRLGDADAQLQQFAVLFTLFVTRCGLPTSWPPA
jgi:hypothetical protein